MLEREGGIWIIQNFLGTVGEVLSTIIYSLIIVNTGKINIDFKLLTFQSCRYSVLNRLIIRQTCPSSFTEFSILALIVRGCNPH